MTKCLQELDNNMGFVKAAIARSEAGSDSSEGFLNSSQRSKTQGKATRIEK